MNFCHKAQHVWGCPSALWLYSWKEGSRSLRLCSVFMFRRQQTDLPSLCFKSFCNFFLSRCESKELDVEIRNLIERSGVSKSCEDSELIAQGSLNHQRTSCSPKVNTLSQLLSVRAERSRHVPCVGYAGNCLISEMMHWTRSVFFFSDTATLCNEEVKMRRRFSCFRRSAIAAGSVKSHPV